jgi:hypothetical protein
MKGLPPNGLRYPLVGGMRQRHFTGTHFKPRIVPENAQTPTTIALMLSQGSGARFVSWRGLPTTLFEEETAPVFAFVLISYKYFIVFHPQNRDKTVLILFCE